MRSLTLTKPYNVGARRAKSLALVIPSKIVKESQINTSTIFAVQFEEETRKIILTAVDNVISSHCESQKISADKSFAGLNQQISEIH